MKETIQIRTKIYEIESKKTMEKINETKSWYFEEISKTDQSLSRLMKKKKGRGQNLIKSEIKNITTDNTEIQRIITHFYRQLYANKTDNLEEMEKFLDRHGIPKLNQEEIEIMNRPSTEIELVIF